MSFAEKNRIFLDKMRNLPEQKKKIILWTIVVVLAIIMGIFWIRSAANTLEKIGESTKNVNFPELNMPDIPAMPDLNILQTVTPTSGE